MNRKISQLSDAEALIGDELLPIVQNNETVKLSIASLYEQQFSPDEILGVLVDGTYTIQGIL